MDDPTLEGYLNRKNSTDSSLPPPLFSSQPPSPPLPFSSPPPSSPAVIVDPPLLYSPLNSGLKIHETDIKDDYGVAPIDCYEVDEEGGSTALMQVRRGLWGLFNESEEKGGAVVIGGMGECVLYVTYKGFLTRTRGF